MSKAVKIKLVVALQGGVVHAVAFDSNASVELEVQAIDYDCPAGMVQGQIPQSSGEIVPGGCYRVDGERHSMLVQAIHRAALDAQLQAQAKSKKRESAPLPQVELDEPPPYTDDELAQMRGCA